MEVRAWRALLREPTEESRMTSPTTTILQPKIVPSDGDLIDQARPGHGVPSQDTDAAAQFPLEPQEAEREVQSVLMGGGVVAGMATGAAIGVATAGPVGVLVGASLGAVVGALGGAVAGSAEIPQDAAMEGRTPERTTRVPLKHAGR
jgi:non-heme chloroperoxidase